MALADMLRALEEEGSSQQEDILRSAKNQAAEIVKTAKAQTAEIEEIYANRASKSVEEETSKILAEAKRSVERGVSKAKENLIEDVFASALADLEKTRFSDGYEAVFRGIAHEAMDRAEGHVVIHIDARDKKLAETALKESDVDYVLVTDIVTDCGLIISAEEGRVIVDNTLESRASRARVFIKSQVAARLFGGA